jgi:hypothetical protein
MFVKNSDLENSFGDVAFDGNINSGETKTLKYYIKTTNENQKISPRAILQYTDYFNRSIKIYTQPQVIEIKENQGKLNAYIDIPKTIIIKKIYDGKLILRNTSENELNNIYIKPHFEGGIINLQEYNINKIQMNDVIEIPFTIKSLDLKEHKLSFKITHDTNKTISTQTINIQTQKPNTDMSKLIAILLITTFIFVLWSFKF